MRLDKTRITELEKLESIIDYSFNDKTLLNSALTHSSFANENGLGYAEYNERLEFLGDAVLEMVTSEYLFGRFYDYPEGTLTKIRACVVRGHALVEYASSIGLGDFLLLGKGQEFSGGRSSSSILADAFEAVIGSVYMDGGYVSVQKFVLGYIEGRVDECIRNGYSYDSKTCLQENLQAQNAGAVGIEYRLTDQKGPDHDKTFTVQVLVDGKVFGEGTGKSKKEAEQNAAQKAMGKLVK